MSSSLISFTYFTANAEIAQLVEHNLAKVGVASSSLVFRSLTSSESPGGGMVDAHVSGACVERHAGSSPVLGTLDDRRLRIGGMAELVDALL